MQHAPKTNSRCPRAWRTPPPPPPPPTPRGNLPFRTLSQHCVRQPACMSPEGSAPGSAGPARSRRASRRGAPADGRRCPPPSVAPAHREGLRGGREDGEHDSSAQPPTDRLQRWEQRGRRCICSASKTRRARDAPSPERRQPLAAVAAAGIRECRPLAGAWSMSETKSEASPRPKCARAGRRCIPLARFIGSARHRTVQATDGLCAVCHQPPTGSSSPADALLAQAQGLHTCAAWITGTPPQPSVPTPAPQATRNPRANATAAGRQTVLFGCGPHRSSLWWLEQSCFGEGPTPGRGAGGRGHRRSTARGRSRRRASAPATASGPASRTCGAGVMDAMFPDFSPGERGDPVALALTAPCRGEKPQNRQAEADQLHA